MAMSDTQYENGRNGCRLMLDPLPKFDWLLVPRGCGVRWLGWPRLPSPNETTRPTLRRTSRPIQVVHTRTKLRRRRRAHAMSSGRKGRSSLCGRRHGSNWLGTGLCGPSFGRQGGSFGGQRSSAERTSRRRRLISSRRCTAPTSTRSLRPA